MEMILRAAAVYAFVWLIFRLAGKRTLSETTTFDFALVLIISETVQQALIKSDNSITNAFLLIITMVGLDVLLSLFKQRSRAFEKFMDGAPLVILEHGRPIREYLTKARVDETDILAAARRLHGLERLDQIKYAVLECSGEISIIPAEAR